MSDNDQTYTVSLKLTCFTNSFHRGLTLGPGFPYIGLHFKVVVGVVVVVVY